MRHSPWLQVEHSLVGGPSENSWTWDAGAGRDTPQGRGGRRGTAEPAPKAALAEHSEDVMLYHPDAKRLLGQDPCLILCPV